MQAVVAVSPNSSVNRGRLGSAHAVAAILGLAITLGFGLPSHAHPSSPKKGLEACLEAVHKIKSGDIVKVEYLSFTDEGLSAYEIEIRDSTGISWELECAAGSTNIIEIEREVSSAQDKLFATRAKLNEGTAKETALALYPGTVVEVEYEIAFDGEPIYELDIRTPDTKEFKVEVSAVTGMIVEVQAESWQIGLE